MRGIYFADPLVVVVWLMTTTSPSCNPSTTSDLVSPERPSVTDTSFDCSPLTTVAVLVLPTDRTARLGTSSTFSTLLQNDVRACVHARPKSIGWGCQSKPLLHN